MITTKKKLTRPNIHSKEKSFYYDDCETERSYSEETNNQILKLTAEVLEVMRDLAKEGMTMIVVTHEMGFAKEVSSHVVFMADGNIVEEGEAKEFFASPKQQRTREFLRIEGS